MPQDRTQLSAAEEERFQRWYRGWADKTGIDPNPDHPGHLYDYRGAFKAGAEPSLAGDGKFHWPSRFKDAAHPNRFVSGVDTKTGMPQGLSIMQLHPDSYEPVSSGGRWFNLPTTHPVKGVPMEVEQAISFALDHGYLGIGYASERLARGAAQYRAEAMLDESLPVPPDVRDVPYNPGGRAPDGFLYPELDGILVDTARERDRALGPTPTPFPASPERQDKMLQRLLDDAGKKALDDAVESLIGGP